jgi:predicted DNA-binding protein with PD1-like motif
MIRSRVNDIAETNNTMLEVVLDDGDEIVECVENAFVQNNVKKASLVSAFGKLRMVKVATTRTGTLKQREYAEPCSIKSVSGDFTKIKENEYMGDFHISIARDEIHAVSGVLIKGTADGEVKIVFKVIAELDEGAIYSPDGKKEVTMVKQKVLDETTTPPKPKKEMIVA